VKTAETHRSNIMSKLGLHSVSELVMYAVRNNIVQTYNSVSASEPPPSTEETVTSEPPKNDQA
jgi:hypothetical protein